MFIRTLIVLSLIGLLGFGTVEIYGKITESTVDTQETQQVSETTETPGDESSIETPDDVEQNRDVLCLALNIYHESRGDSLAGQVAVADVVLNRVESKYFPESICQVVEQAVLVKNWKGNIVPKRNQCQFSWYCDGVSDEPGDPDAWMESYMLAQQTLAGGWRGITDGATHYHAAHVRPVWAQDRGMVYKGTIGQHEFYKWH